MRTLAMVILIALALGGGMAYADGPSDIYITTGNPNTMLTGFVDINFNVMTDGSGGPDVTVVTPYPAN